MCKNKDRWLRWIGALIVLAFVLPSPVFAQDLNRKIEELDRR